MGRTKIENFQKMKHPIAHVNIMQTSIGDVGGDQVLVDKVTLFIKSV